MRVIDAQKNVALGENLEAGQRNESFVYLQFRHLARSVHAIWVKFDAQEKIQARECCRIADKALTVLAPPMGVAEIEYALVERDERKAPDPHGLWRQLFVRRVLCQHV